MTALLQCNALSCGYRSKAVLEDVTFKVSPGEVVALLGPNGSGKSTLLKTLAKTLPAISGSIAIDGKDLRELSYPEAARLSAFVPQEEHVPFDFRVREIVMMGRLPHSKTIFDSKEDEQIAASAMEEADCTELAERSILELSGGEKQRVWLARALAQRAKLLLLDEPTSHLDVSHQLSLLALVRKLCRQGLGIVIALHDLNLAAYVADRGLLLKQGRVALDSGVQELLKHPLLDDVYGVQFERIADAAQGVRVIPKQLLLNS